MKLIVRGVRTLNLLVTLNYDFHSFYISSNKATILHKHDLWNSGILPSVWGAACACFSLCNRAQSSWRPSAEPPEVDRTAVTAVKKKGRTGPATDPSPTRLRPGPTNFDATHVSHWKPLPPTTTKMVDGTSQCRKANMDERRAKEGGGCRHLSVESLDTFISYK